MRWGCLTLNQQRPVWSHRRRDVQIEALLREVVAQLQQLAGKIDTLNATAAAILAVLKAKQ